MALGAGAGALSGALTDFGIRDQFMKDLASKVRSGDAVLFLLIQSMTSDKVLNAIKDAGGIVLTTSLDEKREQHLRDALAAATQAKPA
ncbi:putative membrane protein [Bradyrhizobium sp. USDA 10063]